VQSKARRNQLNLPHGTKRKTEYAKNGEQPESIMPVWKKEGGPVVGRICETDSY